MTKIDIHQQITDRIVEAIETAPDFQLPWTRSTGGCFKRPINVASSNAYNGVNVLSLWVASQANAYPSHLWGTYRQWQARGAQVRKGEKASPVVFYKRLEAEEDHDEGSERSSRPRLIAKASSVFNAAQVEGFTVVADTAWNEPEFGPIERAEAFARSTGASIVEYGERACYIPATDYIQMPDRRRFKGTATSTPAEGFYSTLFHELVHWSGAKARLSRDLGNRFGGEAYAVEELIAELGAAFLCSDLEISPEPRPDHAAYIRSWLTVLKSDKKAIFTAASKASEANRFLLAFEKNEDRAAA